MSLRSLLAAALVAAMVSFLPAAASAYDCFAGGFGHYAWNYHRMPLRTGNVPAPPYFALHPPVYYSGLQYRPYGDSPFAYWPMRPLPSFSYGAAAATASPKLIENPYFGAEPGANTTGQMIINPYYDADGDQLARQ